MYWLPARKMARPAGSNGTPSGGRRIWTAAFEVTEACCDLRPGQASPEPARARGHVELIMSRIRTILDMITSRPRTGLHAVR